MRMRFLGKTGLQVSELCLGTAGFGGTGEFKANAEINQPEADYIVGMALDAGINFINTAELYSYGWAEEILGKALGKRRKEAIVITKVHPTKGPGAAGGGHSRKHMIESCNASLKRLKTDYIDIYELHAFDPDTPLEVTLRTLDDLVRDGKVRYFGCSNYTGWQVMKALSISDQNGWDRFVTLEAMYSLVAREAEYELVPVCLDQQVAILAWSPLHAGFLTGKYRRHQPWPRGTRFEDPEHTEPWQVDLEKLYDIVDELDIIAKNHNATVSQAALNWLLRQPGICSLIVGLRTSKHLEENLKAMDWELTPEEAARLDKISEPVRKYPYYVYDPVKAAENA